MAARAALIGVLCAVAMAGAAPAAKTLTRHDAQDIARDAARKECLRTPGCQTYRAYGVKTISRVKAVGKLEVQALNGGVGRVCKRKLTMTLDPKTGNVGRSLATRHCVAIASTS
jgi:hypothetical protein